MGAWGYESDANDSVLDAVFAFYTKACQNCKTDDTEYQKLTEKEADAIFAKEVKEDEYDPSLTLGVVIHLLGADVDFVSKKQIKKAIEQAERIIKAKKDPENWDDFKKRKEMVKKERAMLKLALVGRT